MTELLVPEPKPKPLPSMRWLWVAAVLLFGGVTLQIGAVGYMIGFGDAEQARTDAAYYQGLAEKCAVSFDTVARQSLTALVETRRAQLYMAAAAAYANQMGRPTLMADTD